MALNAPYFTNSSFVFLPATLPTGGSSANDNCFKFKLNNTTTDLADVAIYYQCWEASGINPETDIQIEEETDFTTDIYGISSLNYSNITYADSEADNNPLEEDTFYKFLIKLVKTDANDNTITIKSSSILFKISSVLEVEIDEDLVSEQATDILTKNPLVLLYNIIRNEGNTDNIAQYNITISSYFEPEEEEEESEEEEAEEEEEEEEEEFTPVVCYQSENILNNKYDNIQHIIYSKFYDFNQDDYLISFKYITNYGYIGTYEYILENPDWSFSYSRVALQIIANNEKGCNIITGSPDCLLFRCSNKDNFHNYEYITTINANGIFEDRLIEDGIDYHYILCNPEGTTIYCNAFPQWDAELEKFVPQTFINEFENDFITDPEHQLIIKFNSSLSNYRQTFLSSIQTTIGSQYPIVNRVGKNNYKTFNVGGLITYQSEAFEVEHSEGHSSTNIAVVEKSPVFHGNTSQDSWSVVFNDTFDPNDPNEIKKERLFRDKVLEFLSSDTIKLFRTATEGNIFVSLKDITLTPAEQTGRRMYTFQASATEIAPVNDKYLRQFHFIK